MVFILNLSFVLSFAFFCPSALVSHVGIHIFIYIYINFISDYFFRLILRNRVTGQREETVIFYKCYPRLLSRKVSVYTLMNAKCDILTEESYFFEYTVWLVVKTVDLYIVFC